MVAYSFQAQFVAPIQTGLGLQPHLPGTDYVPKRHTIRADRKRHARPGEELQLYRGMRTKACFLIGKARCTAIRKIELVFWGKRLGVWLDGKHAAASPEELDAFAQSDGFEGWPSMGDFWKENHDDPQSWKGVIIYWEPLPKQEAV